MKACRIAFSENDAANREDAAAINFQNIFSMHSQALVYITK